MTYESHHHRQTPYQQAQYEPQHPVTPHQPTHPPQPTPPPGQPWQSPPAAGYGPAGYQPPPGYPAQQYPQAPRYQRAATGGPIGKKRGAWSVWWLCGITFGIYYFVWFAKINRELTDYASIKRDASCAWWSQLIPIYGLVALARTARRINQAADVAHVRMEVSGFMAWFSTFWFASQTRYLQRRANRVWDAAYGGQQALAMQQPQYPIAPPQGYPPAIGG